MKARLLHLLPGMRWVPHDIPSQDGLAQTHKSKSRRNPFSSKATSDLAHGPRNSTVSFTSQLDAERTHAQAQSGFFAKLPGELRSMVYAYVMGAEVVHLTLGAKKRFGHFVCEAEAEAGNKARGCRCRVLVGGREGERLGTACVRVLMVCRKMYSESIPHLYRPHTFSLLHLTHLLYLPTRLPQPRLATIRTLRLRWAIRALPYLRRGPSHRLAYREDTANWERGWAILAGMAGLRDLYVVLVDPSPQGMWERNWLELEEQLLGPVREVTAPKWFELVLPFEGCRTDWDMGGSSVVLRKPEGEVVDEE